ncbi:response regulator [Gramella jeungdoensis]|uniref:Response regulator n=1 Tax=Gramella jeungdoensis TaxID=708091 RepID=A0ABT0Z5R7_9FLAO|nr:response regulator [Gramella jeungdoensis]MCM8571071.1 response regulator [Gramella jeungdoensis]
MGSKILYVVDDDDIFQFMVKRSIKALDQNIEVITYTDGQEAINGLKKDCKTCHIPDIILLDINMPIMDGWQFLDFYDQLKYKIDKDISIYIVSSSANPEDIHKAREMNDLSGYITKPMSRNELKNIIENTPHNYWIVSSA